MGVLDHAWPIKVKFLTKKYYDDFDYVEWFNSAEK